MKLSVIVPVYNMAAEDKLKWCLDSLVNQTLGKEDYEILAVDDCSTDDSMEILRAYETQYPGLFHAIHSPVNHHQGGAKNLGLAAARGEWIGFIDADDWVTSDYYEKLLSLADKTGADMVGCDLNMVDHHTMEKGTVEKNSRPDQVGELDEAKYRSLILDSGSLVVKIYRREVIFGRSDPMLHPNNVQAKGVNADEQSMTMAGSGKSTMDTPATISVFPEDIFYEDNAVSNTWMLRAKRYAYLEEDNYYYYQHDASTVHTISRKNLEDRKSAGRLMLQAAKDGNYLETYKEEIEYKFTVLFYVNTLFSAMPKQYKVPHPYRFTKELAKEMKETFPAFQENKYYQEKTHPEEKKLIQMQMKSHLLFFCYYRLLWFYRNLRK